MNAAGRRGFESEKKAILLLLHAIELPYSPYCLYLKTY